MKRLIDISKNKNILSSSVIFYIQNDEYTYEQLIKALINETKNLTVVEKREAISLLEHSDPDIIIAGINEEVANDLEIIKNMRNIKQTTPIIIITNHNDERLFLRLIDLGIYKYVKKPVDYLNLRESIYGAAIFTRQTQKVKLMNNFIFTLLDINPSMLAIVSEDGVRYMNLAFKHYVGVRDIKEFKEKYKEIINLMQNVNPQVKNDFQLGQSMQKETLGSNEGYLVEFKKRRGNKSQSLLLTSVSIPPENKEYLLHFTNITRLEEEKKRYKYFAEYDVLTKIYNKRKIDHILMAEITNSIANKSTLSIIMLDIDHFKKVNDTYGHKAGDRVLTEFADVLAKAVRTTDILGRFGGEEFIILLPDTPLENACETAKRACGDVAAQQFSHINDLTCSAGVTEYKAGESAEVFVKRVDEAMYLAKKNGRNRVESL